MGSTIRLLAGLAIGAVVGAAVVWTLAGQPREASAEPEPAIALGQSVTLRSELLGEDRPLLVFLPASYRGSTFRYPVLYLLDAEGGFLHTAGIVDFLASTDQIPEMIVVGVVNTDRARDLTPESPNDTESPKFWGTVGGADRFRRFFREELIPYVDRAYRTEPYRVLRGQSFGGLFAIHDYMSDRPTFQAYLTSSPGVTWNADELILRAPEFFAAGFPLPLYVSTAGRENAELLAGIRKFNRLLDERHDGAGPWLDEHFEDESHYSLVHRSTYSALRFLYDGWQVPDEVGTSARFAEYEAHYARLSDRYGYTIRIPMRSVIRLGNQLLREQRFDEGIAVHRRNLELYPEQPEGYWHVGDSYVLAGQPEKARPFYEQAYRKAQAMSVADVDDYRLSLERLDRELAQ